MIFNKFKSKSTTPESSRPAKTPPPPQTPTLTNLPVEVRWKIYAHLLLDTNVVSITPDKNLCLSFDTSLFLVSRQISAEALEYFYTKNTFVLFETSEKNLLGACREILPIIRFSYPRIPPRVLGNANVDGERLPPVACTMQYCDLSRAHTRQQRGAGVAILTARSLLPLIRLLNIEHSLPEYELGTISLTLDFSQRQKEFSPRAMRNRERILEDLRTLRKTPGLVRRGLTLEMGGDLDAREMVELRASFERASLSPGDFVDMAFQARDRAQLAMENGDFLAARGELRFCSYVMLHNAYNHGRFRFLNTHIPIPGDLDVDVLLDMSLVESVLGFHEDAVWSAEKAWEKALSSDDPFARVADLKFSLGVALANAGRWVDAVGALTHAVAFEAGNENMRAMLESLKALVEVEREGGWGGEIEEGEESLRWWFRVAMVERRALRSEDLVV